MNDSSHVIADQNSELLTAIRVAEEKVMYLNSDIAKASAALAANPSSMAIFMALASLVELRNIVLADLNSMTGNAAREVPEPQPLATMDHGCAPEPVPVERQQQIMALNELIPRGREYIPSPYEDPVSSIHALVGEE